ncbi:MAG: polysaccharide biosynthesis C-terminal domain-containing protein [Ruminococcus sp.]|nr:polysaccharide biosynthesis C-terminal domain-containing protein [Ruminococcus sp.]
MNKYKKLAFNTIVFAIGTFGSKILVILLTNLYTKNISSDGMSDKDLLDTMVLFLQPVFTFALQEYLIRFGLDKNYDKREVFTTSFCMTFIGMAASAALIPLLGMIPFFNFINGYTLVLIVYLSTSSLRMLCAQFVRSRDMVKLFSLDGILATLTLFIFNIVFISHMHLGVRGSMYAVILSDFCSSVFLFAVGGLQKFLGRKYLSGKLAKIMLKFSLPLIPTIVMWTITGLSDRLFIRYMTSERVQLGAGAAGLYAVANKIPNLISMVSTIFFQAWNMSAITENDSEDRSIFYEKVYSAYEAMLFMASAGLILFARPISSIIANSSTYSEYGTVYIYTPVLIIAVLFTCLNQFLGSIYTATKHTKNSFWTALIACCVNLFMNYMLIPEWGIQGASVATFLSYYICFWVRMVDARYYVPFRFDKFKSLLNTVLLLEMSRLMIFECDDYMLRMGIITAAVCAINFRSLLSTVQKLIKR